MNQKEKEGISLSRKLVTRAEQVLMNVSFIFILALLAVLIGYILFRGIPNVTWSLLSQKPSVLKNTIGILPNILNTVYIIIITLIFVLPLGVGTAIYLNEYAENPRIVGIIEFATETLAGIPSIIYGLAGMLIFVQFFSLGTSILAGALTLVIMTLPTIIRTTEESLKTVPDSYREGSLALGAGKWYMIRTVVLPSSIDGIITGCILAIGRIVGETAALIYTSGTIADVALNPMNSGRTLAVHMYSLSREGLHTDQANATAVVLLIIVFLINGLSGLVSRKFIKGEQEA